MTTSSSQSFGDLLRRYRLAAGLTQEDLAAQARLSVRGKPTHDLMDTYC